MDNNDQYMLVPSATLNFRFLPFNVRKTFVVHWLWKTLYFADDDSDLSDANNLDDVTEENNSRDGKKMIALVSLSKNYFPVPYQTNLKENL